MTPLLILRGFFHSTEERSSVPIPEGTRVGDLIVVQAHAGNDGGKNQPLGGEAFGDPRLENRHSHASGDDAWWIATETDLTAVVRIAVPAGGFIRIASFGPPEGGTLELGNPVLASRVGDEQSRNPIPIPSFDAQAVVILATEDNGSGSGGPSFEGFDRAGGGTRETSVIWWTGEAPTPPYLWVNDRVYQEYDRSVSILPILLSGATPVRQYPRDDGLGHSSATRKYPPVKRGRIVGGYQ